MLSLFNAVLSGVKLKVSRRILLTALGVSFITFLGFLLRLYPFFLYPPYISDYDSTIQYYQAAFISIYGYSAWFGWYNPKMWYPHGLDMSQKYLPGVPFTAAAFFFFLKALGFNVDINTVCYVLPAVMGAASCVLIFFIGREVLDDTAGLISSFMYSFLPGAIERSIAGLVDNECVGLFFFLLSLLFFIRSLKKSSVSSAVISGLALGGFIASWGASMYLLYIYPLTVVLLVLMKRYSTNLLLSYSITVLLGVFVGTRIPFHGSSYMVSSTSLPAMLILALLVVLEAAPRIKPFITPLLTAISRKTPQLYEKLRNKRNITIIAVASLAAILIVITFAASMNPFFSLALSTFTQSIFSISGRYLSVVVPSYRQEEIIVASVAEHALPSWAMIFYDLHVAVLLFPVGMYLAFQRRKDEDIFLILLGLTTVYFASSMVRLIVLFAPIACLFAGFALSRIYSPLSKIVSGEQKIIVKRRYAVVKRILGRESAAAVLILTGLILFFSFSHGATVAIYSGAPQFVPRDRYGNVYLDWFEAFIFMQNKLPEDAIVASWWDYGYWIMVRGNKTTIVDNATLNTTQIALIGRALTTTNETESLQILRLFNATHVLVYFGHNDPNLHGDEGKWIWMVRIPFDVYLSTPWIFPSPPAWEYEYYTPTLTGTIYTPKFFNTTLYKLLYYHDPPPEVYPVYSEKILDYQLYQYMKQNNFPLVISYREVEAKPGWYSGWSNFSILKYFKPVFISSNHLVKIYEIDYSILDANMNITASVYTNGSGLVHVQNIGRVSFNVTAVYLNNTLCNISPVKVNPGEIIQVPFTSNLTFEIGVHVPLKIETSIPDFTREIIVEVTSES